jgi:hypothetical protein
MCGCNDQVLTFESMINDPMFRMLMAADKISLDELTALYTRTSFAIAAQQLGDGAGATAWGSARPKPPGGSPSG